jgi:hypothetical protein
MDQGSTRVYLLNTLTLIISLTNLEAALKILLLVISIIFTGMKIYDWIIGKIKKKNVING